MSPYNDPMDDEEEADFTMSVMSMPVHDEGVYITVLNDIKLNERVKWGVKKDIEQASANEKEPTARFYFAAVNAEKPYKDKDCTILNPVIYFNEDAEEDMEVKFSKQTSLVYMPGNKRAASTAVLKAIIGREPSKEEIKQLSMRALAKAMLPVKLVIIKKDNEDGTQSNSIASLSRPTEFNGKKLSPTLDLTPFLKAKVEQPVVPSD